MNNARIMAAAAVCCLVASASCSLKDGSLVHVVYSDLVGAPVLNRLRVLWGMDDLAREVMTPGEEITGVLDPKGGGGPMTVLWTIDGEQYSWTGDVGAYDDGQRYGVEIRIDPIGTVTRFLQKRAPVRSALQCGELLRVGRRRVHRRFHHARSVTLSSLEYGEQHQCSQATIVACLQRVDASHAR